MRRNSSIFPPSAVSDPTEMTFLLQQLDPGDKVTFFYRVNETSPVKSMTVEVEDKHKSATTLYVYLKKKGPMRPGQTGGPALEAGYFGVKYAASMGAKRIPVLALSKGSASMLEDKAPTMRAARANPRRAHAGEHRIYVANLAAYNAGKLRGKWIEPSTDADELREQVLEAIGGNPDHEWAFHDYDAFPNMGENPNLDDVAAMAEILEEHPYAVVKAATDFVGDDVDALKEWLDEGYGIYESDRDYVEQLIDDAGGPSKALGKDAINFYFDYDAFGHDLSIDADEEDSERYEGMSDEEIGMQYMDDVYGDEIPKDLVDRYFDFDAYARDVFLEVASKYIRGEGLVVFNAR
jgi:antirestriction protein